MAKTLSRRVTIYVNGQEVKSTLADLTKEMMKLQAEQKKMIIGSDEYVKTGLKIKEIKDVLDAQKMAMKEVEGEWDRARKKASEYGNILMGLKTMWQKISDVIGWAKGFVEEAAAMDDAYADVMKTTGMTYDEVVKLNEAFKEMDTRTAREQLNLLASEAGKLGLQTREEVESFVKAADKINIALGEDLGEGAMVTIGKLTTVYSKSTKELADASEDIGSKMLKIGSALNSLGAASSANEAYMSDFLSRLGGVASQADISAQQILGYASALNQLNLPVEKSATAFQNFLMKMYQVPEAFADIAKKDVAEFKDMLQNDMDGAIKAVLAGLNEAGGMDKLGPLFKDLKLAGSGVTTTLASLSKNLDLVNDAQAIANEQMQTGNSILDEANTKNNTRQAQMEKAKDSYHNAAVALGDELYPAYIKVTNAGTGLMKGLTWLAKSMIENKALLLGLVSVILTWQRAKLASLAVSIKERVERTKNNYILSQEEKLRRKNAAAAAQETLATEEARLAKIKENIALNEAIVARKKEYAAIGAENVVMAAERNLRSLNIELEKQQAVVTNATTKAMEAKAAAARKIPWTFIVMGLVSIIAKLNELRKKSENFKIGEATKEASAQLHTATLKIDALFRAIKKAEKGSDEYKTAINNLKKAYPGLLEKELDHEGNLKNIKTAYDNIKAAAKDSIYTEVKMRQLQKKMDEAGETVGNLEEKTINKFRREYKGIVSDTWIEDKIDLISEAFSKLDGTTKGLANAQKFLKDNGVWTRYLHNNIIDANKALESYSQFEKRVNKTLKTIKDVTADITTPETTTPPTNPPGTENPDSPENVEKDLKKKVKALDSALEEVEKLTNSFNQKTESGLQKLVDDVELKMDQARDKLIEAAKDMGYVEVDLEGKLTFTGKDDNKTYKALENLENAAAKLKATKIDSYIEKLKDAYWKLAESMGDTDAAGRLMAESDKLQDAIANIDKAIEQAEADATVATGEHQKELQRLIAYYRELKAEIGGELYRRVREVQSAFEVVENQVWNPDTGEWVIQPTIKINKAQMEKQTKDAAEAIKKLIEGIEIEPTAFQKWCNKNLDIVEDFANKALSIFSNINTILNNISDQRIKDLEDEKDANIKTLDEQLEQGLISQETYDQKKQDIEDEYNKKANEEKKKQWQRDKAFSLSEATIAAALAAVKVWAAEGTTAYKVAMSALLAAELATQIAAIASQPEPYAKGGYVDRDTVFRAGEAGREWIASNQLLNDPVAGPTIEALESYQRGNRRALGDIPMARMNMPVALAAARELGSRTTSSSSGRITASKGDDMLKVMKELASYLEDPKNRQAIISRQTMTDFDTNEQFLRSRASI